MSAATGTAPAPGQVAVHGPPYTGHGHLVHGFSPEGWQEPTVTARCGGPALCATCGRDAERIRLIEGFEQPRLGYATTRQLLDEIAARVELGDVPPQSRSVLMTGVGDLKELLAKWCPSLLAYRTAGSDRG